MKNNGGETPQTHLDGATRHVFCGGQGVLAILDAAFSRLTEAQARRDIIQAHADAGVPEAHAVGFEANQAIWKLRETLAGWRDFDVEPIKLSELD